jgi:hypothetical protein
MTIEQLWLELEAELAAGSNAAWLTRFARPQPGPALLVALEQITGSRALMLPVSRSLIPLRRDWPECRGLEIFTVALNGSPHLGVRLRDKSSADVFTALAEDISPRVSAAAGTKEALSALLGRLGRWQQFLAAMKEGLSLEARRGLFGELHVLKAHLIPVFGNVEAVGSWKASAAAHQDFQFTSGAIEVKTTAAKQPQAVRITSERQLDDTGVGALFLHVVAVDEREVTSAGKTSGATLPDLIAVLRAMLAPDTFALQSFNDRLLDAGYLDVHASRYQVRRYTLRREWTFRVTGRFPRITEDQLPEGIGEVSYALSLAACSSFSVEKSAFLSALNAPYTKQKAPKRKTKWPNQ